MHQSDHPDQYQHRYLINWIEYSQDVTPDSVFLLLVTCIQSQQADQFVFLASCYLAWPRQMKHTEAVDKFNLFCWPESCGSFGRGLTSPQSKPAHTTSSLSGWTPEKGTGRTKWMRRFLLPAWLVHTQLGTQQHQFFLLLLLAHLPRPPPPAGPTADTAHRGWGSSVL